MTIIFYLFRLLLLWLMIWAYTRLLIDVCTPPEPNQPRLGKIPEMRDM